MKITLASWCHKSGNKQLLAEWDNKKNSPTTPNDVTFRSAKRVWWKCSKGHKWEAMIYNRTRGRGCPYCANRIVVPGENDLQTLYPEIANELHPTKNKSLIARDVVAGSEKKVWWKCKEGHEWQASISNRTTNHTGCPKCYKIKRKTKTNNPL